MNTFHAPVGIVGAGPIGMVTALRLAAFGVRSVLLETSPALAGPGSRACQLHGDVLEILDRSRCARTLHTEGLTWTVTRAYAQNRQISAGAHPRGLAFGPFCGISQDRLEQVLAAAVEAEPLCELRRRHDVTGLSQDHDAVTLLARTPDGPIDLRFSYLVATDDSGVRELLGVEWTGYTHRDRFLVADVRARLPLAKGCHVHYDPSCNPGRRLIMHPQPHDVWRIDWQLPPEADIEAERADGRFDERVRKVVGDVPYELHCVATHRFHQRVAARLRLGRVLLAGEAAHALPPYGSRGLNSGIQDADNLAWKLAYVLSGQAGEDLLDSYHDERHAAARKNLRLTEAATRFMIPARWVNSTLLRLSHRLGLARHATGGTSAEPYTYTGSPIVQTGPDPMLGSFAMDGRIRMNGERTRLRTLFGSQFVVLCVAWNAERAAALVEAATSRPWEIAARLVVVLPTNASARPLPRGVAVARAEDGELSQAYGADRGAWWVVRPDGHLAARGEHGQDVPIALSASIGSPTPADRPLVPGIHL